MIENAKNKDMASQPAAEVRKQEYHFAGGTEFAPMTILAEDADTAYQIYLEKRVPLPKE